MGLGRGRDATALFEAHHPFTSRTKLKGLMAKYAVSEEEAKRLGLKTLDSRGKKDRVFDWGPDGFDRELTPFEKELKEEVTAYFQKEAEKRGVSLLEATKATKSR